MGATIILKIRGDKHTVYVQLSVGFQFPENSRKRNYA